MEIDLKKNFQKHVLAAFCEQYEIENVETIKEDDHTYFRFLCFSYIDFIRTLTVPVLKYGSHLESVFIEFRILPHIEFIIRNVVIKLGSDWSHTIICGNMNYDFMVDMCFRISPQIKVINTGLDNVTANYYNIMLSSAEFWELFEGDHILIYQEDTIMFKTNMEPYLKYDYIGAPFPKNQNDTPNLVGNGGFSLRSKAAMLRVIKTISLIDTNYNSSTMQYMRNTGLINPPEDVYFSKNLQDLNLGQVAPYDIALNFSSESVPNKKSLGGHKFWVGNPEWKIRMKKEFGFTDYTFQSDLYEYLRYYNISNQHSRVETIKNAFDIDLHFCDVVNNLNIGNNEDVMKYIRHIGLIGFVYHPKQIINMFPDVGFYKFMKEIFILYKLQVYKASDFISRMIYNASYEDFHKLLIKNKFYKLNHSNERLVTLFIGNEEKGIDLLQRLIKYKEIENFNLTICLNSSQHFSDSFKDLIKNNFEYYAIYACKEMGTDITPTMLMMDDVLKRHPFKHIVKLHTKSISNHYTDLTTFVLTHTMKEMAKMKRHDCNCVGHPDYYIPLSNDIFNTELFIKHASKLNTEHCFVGGTIFYCPGEVFAETIQFIKKNQYRSYILNNLYENNCINKSYSPIHFIERLYGVLKMSDSL
jgi:hypothetical protein